MAEQAKKKSVAVDPNQWVDEHGDALFSYAMMHLHNSQEAQELVQDAFVAALGAYENFEGRSSERSWLISILKHKIIDHIRKVSRRRKVMGQLDDDPMLERIFDDRGQFAGGLSPWSEDPSVLLERKDFQVQLEACIASLPERLGRAFMLREVEQLSSDEVCNVLGITSTNLWVMLHRARLRLRTCLEKKWFSEGDNS